MADYIPSSVATSIILSPDCDKYLTTYDVQQGGAVHFSGCLIYDMQSEEVVRKFVANMNRINEYLIFVDPHKDILVGYYEIEVLSQIIDERCAGRVLVFLPQTGDFANPKMKFALQFAKTLDAAGGKRCLVPVRCHNDTFRPYVLQGLMAIDMYKNNSLEFWVELSKQFRPSFSPKGPLRKECIQYNRSYSYHFDSHQGLQMSSFNGQIDEGSSSRPITYPPMGKRQTENSLVDGTRPLVDELSSLQIDNGSRSISYQNNTSLDSSQYSLKEGSKSVYSFAGSSFERGKGIEPEVSDEETKMEVCARNDVASQPHEKKDKKKKICKKWLYPFKKKAK